MSVSAPSEAASPGVPARAASRLPGLDGLRGLAVAWVLAFHLWPDLVRGGWLGVGLFFTLSGYLIAGLLDKEVTATGHLRLGRFMARRVRRLLPAALVTIAATLALTALLDDQPLRTIGIDSLTAALNVFNWHASLDETGYAGIFEAAPEPLAHFWSLAIEEQFYLVFPAAVALIRRPGRVVAAMAVIGLGGVWLWWGSTDAYVATPVRALEIAAGAGLAVAQARYGAVRRLFQPPADLPRSSRIAWAVLLAVAAALTVVSVLRLGPDDGFVFRGGPQLMALCWVVLVIAAVRDGWPARFMSWAPLRWLGLRSYAIYLFHWPVIELTDWHPVVVIVVTLGLAEASFHLLEMPVRRGTGRLAIPVLAAAAAAVVTVAAVAAAASAPERGIAERAEGADELPAWLTEQEEPAVAAPTTQPAPTSAPEQPAPDTAAATVPVTHPTTVEQPDEQSQDPEPSAPDPSASAPAAPTSEQPESEPSPATSEPPVTEAPQPETDSEPIPDKPDGADDATPGTTAPVTAPPQPETTFTVPIVTVLGDSAAVHIADGLREWGNASRLMAVVDHSRIGCSPAGTAGSGWRYLRGNIGDEASPMGFLEDRACRDDFIQDGSHAVLVVDHGAVLFDHLSADGDWVSILDPALAADVADSYRRLVAKARGVGARVMFTTAPVLLPSYDRTAADQPQTSPDRAEAYNTLLRGLVEELNTAGVPQPVGLIDTAAVLDNYGYDGTFGRSDGMHLDYDRAEVFAAEVLGPAVLALLDLE
ncbi:MAG: acyltransferase family protein [Acidimicrobiaceae bacterium]|nr:acyltransferase family protein [Acidimicrobiaceae bacterium]MYL02745.1 acyltransferase family protein [Acidimicrobiaceae bacterium]